MWCKLCLFAALQEPIFFPLIRVLITNKVSAAISCNKSLSVEGTGIIFENFYGSKMISALIKIENFITGIIRVNTM